MSVAGGGNDNGGGCSGGGSAVLFAVESTAGVGAVGGNACACVVILAGTSTTGFSFTT